MPWERFFKVSVLKFGIKPAEFWKTTLPEFWILYEEMFGSDPENEPMSREALEALIEKVENGNDS